MLRLRSSLLVTLLSLGSATLAVGCMAGSDPGGGIDEGGRMTGMTAAHNRIRAGVAGASPAIPPLTWSPSLAAIAQSYADTLAGSGCSLTHSSGPYGENLAWFSGITGTPDRVVDLWAGESACWTYGTFMGTDACGSACSASGCGHYTQLVWRDTTEVGCGVASCGGGEEIWVCNYDPPGNYLGRLAY